jgi:DNA invertase Pin-like site-specific DNA recombinase
LTQSWCGKSTALGRFLKHLVNALAELAALGVAFVSLRDNLDLSTPSGRLMFQIIGAMEAGLISSDDAVIASL